MDDLAHVRSQVRLVHRGHLKLLLREGPRAVCRNHDGTAHRDPLKLRALSDLQVGADSNRLIALKILADRTRKSPFTSPTEFDSCQLGPFSARLGALTEKQQQAINNSSSRCQTMLRAPL